MKYRRVCSLIWTSIKLCMATVHRARVVFCLTLYRLQGVWKSNTIFRGHHGISKIINLSKNCQRGTTCKIPRYLQNKFHYNPSACLKCVTSRQTDYMAKHSKLNRILLRPGRSVMFSSHRLFTFVFFTVKITCKVEWRIKWQNHFHFCHSLIKIVCIADLQIHSTNKYANSIFCLEVNQSCIGKR